MGSLKVIEPGLYTTIQDAGRFAFSSLGIPQSGVMDTYAYRFANMVLGNDQQEAIIEMTWQGATLLFNEDCQIVVTGARTRLTINSKSVPQDSILQVEANDELCVGRAIDGFRMYVAIVGGFKTPLVFNSHSQYQGITKSVKLEKGDVLDYSFTSRRILNDTAHVNFKTNYLQHHTLDVFKGPEFSQLTSAQQKKLLNQEFTVSQHSNRMAYQFEETISNSLSSILTAPVLPGTIQLTPNGQLICLMRDCQATGGYPRVLQLSKSAINSLSQKPIKAKVHFKLSHF